jgi:hypothetical protein
MAGKAWPSEKEQALRELASSGQLNALKMSIELGVSRNSVIAKMQRLGIPSLYKAKIQENSLKKMILKKKKTPEKLKADSVHINHESFNSPTPESKSLYDLTHNECIWPVQCDGKISRLFCGKLAEGSYCIEHTELAYKR